MLKTDNNYAYYDRIKASFSDCPLETLFVCRPLKFLSNLSSNYSPFSGKTTIVSATVDKDGVVERYLFDGCSNLQILIIGNEVTSISDYAFRNCINLNDVKLGSSLTSIESYGFYGCKSLENIILPSCLTSLGSYAFANCSSLAEIIIPDSVTTLSTYTFSNCTGMTNAVLSNSLISIPSGAFVGCIALEKLMLGSGLTSINDNAFTDCSAISQLRSLAPLPPEITTTVFKAVDKEKCQLIVTKGNLVYYWLDPVWKEFINMSDTILCLSPLPTLKYGDAAINLTEYAPAGVTLTYETSNPEVAQIDGTMLSIIGAGVATIGALYDVDDTPMEIIGQMRQFFVDKADLILSAESYTIEAGMPLPQFTISAEGLCYNDTLEDVGELPELYCEADENSEPGEYPIYLVGGASSNYNLNVHAGM